MPTPKLIGRLTREFPTEPKTGSGKGRPLPDDLLRQATRRVEIMALVAAVLWTLAPALSHLALYLTNPSDPQLSIFTRVNLIAGGCVVLSLSMYAYLRTGRRDPERVMDLALLFMVAMTFAMGVLIHWAQPWFVPTSVEPMITWSGPIILMTAGIVPVRPWKMLVAGLIAASMDTIGMLIAGATGDYHYRPAAQRGAHALPQLPDAGRRGHDLPRDDPAGTAGDPGAGDGELSAGRAARSGRNG